ncbi:MAG: cysteine desulfurase [Flavobacteriales bacterium]|nr:cysteine desulfurase [Flavobacteriales bacterium]|tara:strand:+ start:6806 stop:7939 length:1134 start_codon:yes stop_codon:yes gene_type:complete
MKIYLDNAATTPMDPDVYEAMLPILKEGFGNPSSTHSYGRKIKSHIELARKNVAQHLNCSTGELFFTSGGTEADNMAIRCAVRDLGVKHIITSKIEHHAVGNTINKLEKKGKVHVSYVRIDNKGHIDLVHLDELLNRHPNSLVSLMHANNEIGNLLPIEEVSMICKKHSAFFHSDTVQTIAHYDFDMTQMDQIHFMACSAHKFHGPKGIGFLYVNKNINIDPLIHGGSQERNMRGGTENVYGIVGLSKAMDVSLNNLMEHKKHILDLKTHMIYRLNKSIPGVSYNGDSDNLSASLYTVLSVSLPPTEIASMLLFNMDIMGIACSGGSACTSGANTGSHVLFGLKALSDRPTIRFSFSKMNTIGEIDFAVDSLVKLYS